MIERATAEQDDDVLSAVRLGPPAVDWSGMRLGVLLCVACWAVIIAILVLPRVHS